MDPWRDCERLYDPHFADRMSERHLPDEQIEIALINGSKIQESKGEYRINWNRWTIKVTIGTCFVYLWTAFKN